MDSFMPWRIACNFIRAFFPTLILLISWDLWRRLKHVAPATQWAVMTDAIALGVVLSIRLAPPLGEAREQLKHFYRSWESFFWACVVLLPLVLPHRITQANRQDGLLLLAAFAFYSDIVRVCKISLSTGISKASIRAVCTTFWFFAYLVSGAVSLLGQIWERAVDWRDTLTGAANFLVLISLLTLARWWERREHFPAIQELGLNR